jgi:hypothetical protein
MDFSGLYSQFATMFAEDGDGPFWPARILSQGKMAFDNGGSIIPSQTSPWLRDCVVQVDSADTAMRSQQGFAETDRRMIVPAGSIQGPISTDMRIEVRSGPFAGMWSIEAMAQNAAASQWVLRGRKG